MSANQKVPSCGCPCGCGHSSGGCSGVIKPWINHPSAEDIQFSPGPEMVSRHNRSGLESEWLSSQPVAPMRLSLGPVRDASPVRRASPVRSSSPSTRDTPKFPNTKLPKMRQSLPANYIPSCGCPCGCGNSSGGCPNEYQ